METLLALCVGIMVGYVIGRVRNISLNDKDNFASYRCGFKAGREHEKKWQNDPLRQCDDLPTALGMFAERHGRD